MNIGELFRPLLQAIAQALVGLHRLVGGGDSGWSWAAAIVLLTLLIRLLLFPLFVKQIKTQRAMAELQPKIKALQAKHKGDRETLNQELMKLYKEHGANPLAGCLPLLLQMPVFIALYQVLHQLSPKLVDGTLTFPEKFGVSKSVTRSLGQAKIFDAPIAAGFSSPPELLRALAASVTAVKTVSIVLIVSMVITTFLTSRQMMIRNAAQADPAQQTQQRILLYVMPLLLALFGFGVAIGTLIYWTTTNLFGMAQQAYVIHRMPAPGTAGGSAATPAKPSPPPGKGPATTAAKAAPAPAAAAASGGESKPAGSRPAANRSKRKGQRRGGRR